ncbi:TetR/AcrR family transcriptional regulator [Solimonas sp. K1W22B-7]|uniref:TetR/AcrR family transcriptional regulator n=1 Tax=Solimonas sp. K1W22B-7 TaxID=2303331 RepID=UPI000E331DD9|nr:TetR/AcrR family transcriptional regulator [Solimonas sp. K1W22B-7]AXQ28695.1 TetR/AcrR family transcriptional regulator [Solimonas sp. K1W22B-7]
MSRAAAKKPVVRLAREQRVDEILVAARDVFCEKGYEASAVAEIAARMGVVEGTIYKYFASKRELLLKVLEHWYEEMFGDYARDLAGVSDARGRLRLLVWRHLRSIRDYPLLCRLMFREVRSEQDYRGSELHEMNRRYTQFLLEVIEAGVRGGEFRGDLPAALLRDLVYGGIEHGTWNYICGRGELDIDAMAEQLTAVLCEGIARTAEPGLKQEMERLSQIASRIEKALPKK